MRSSQPNACADNAGTSKSSRIKWLYLQHCSNDASSVASPVLWGWSFDGVEHAEKKEPHSESLSSAMRFRHWCYLKVTRHNMMAIRQAR